MLSANYASVILAKRRVFFRKLKRVCFLNNRLFPYGCKKSLSTKGHNNPLVTGSSKYINYIINFILTDIMLFIKKKMNRLQTPICFLQNDIYSHFLILSITFSFRMEMKVFSPFWVFCLCHSLKLATVIKINPAINK